jgi:hypothetical protein
VKRTAGAVVSAVACRPWLWPVAVMQVMRLARPGWWRRFPPVPIPDEGLWRLRIETAYGGSGDAEPSADDVLSFLRWSRDMGHWRRR